MTAPRPSPFPTSTSAFDPPKGLQPTPALARLGTESAFEVLARAKALEADGRSIVNLGIGQPDFAPAPHIVEAAIKALHEGHHGYTPAAGLPELREAVAAELEPRAGRRLDPGRVLIVPGGKVTMFLAILMFGQPGVEIVYPDPGFPIYRSLIDYSGATPVPLPLREAKGFAFSAEEALSLIGPQTRLIILNSPANPTGGVTPEAEVARLVAGLADHPHVAVLSDEIYARLLYDGRKHASLLAYESLDERLILLDGWSKTFAMTGWRLGYSYWPQSLVEPAVRMAINSFSCVNAAAQFAGLAALTGPQDAVVEMHAAFDARRRQVVDGLNDLPGVGCVEPGGAFYAFPNVTGTGLTAKQLETALLETAGVATIAGTSFGLFGEGYLRISYANSSENLKEGLQRIGAFLADRGVA
ncbi:pyridoxal phosphate-dependent aminotransferase [Algihabitans albus]|uniref:pyridoxal phosphate-dependent aminotransferase n=1 Tax=Algihabitans albus TaxID=2164067 RepID=UPI000E5D58B1|nr:pyridoxal phosphate-dependent aminotransferase [Algihabitans albus]